MAWRVQEILEVLFKTKIIDREMRRSLSELRKTRNKLVHGEINDPTEKNAVDCINIGYKLIPLQQ